MSQTWTSNPLCRCCFSEGQFLSMEACFSIDGKEKMYSVILSETFDIALSLTPTSLICILCESRLRDAALFKHQVLASEQRFISSIQGIKDDSSFEVKSEPDSREDELIKEDLKEESNLVDTSHLEHTDMDDQPLCMLKSNESEQNHDEWDVDGFSDDDDSKQSLTKQKKYRCSHCEKQFVYSGSLEMHMRIHSGEKTHVCLLCTEPFYTNKDLTKHFGSKHSDGSNYPCTLCSKVLDKAILLKRHITIHFDKKFKCTKCEKAFKLKKGLKEHMKNHSGERKYQCEVCPKSFMQKHTLKSHMCTHTGEKPYICDMCGKAFPQRTHLQRHIYIIHKQNKPHSCNVCKKKFTSKSYLAIHERQHTGVKPYSCEVCKKDFTAYTTLKVHMRVHTGFKPYPCDFCDRQFAQKASYKLHIRTHTGEKPFSCKICKKNFRDSGYLKSHMLIHSGLKPYTCEVCNRSFRERGQVKRHMSIHTGVRAYNCKICNKNIGNLSKHMKIHMDRDFNCDVCNKRFSVLGNLKSHMKTHS